MTGGGCRDLGTHAVVISCLFFQFLSFRYTQRQDPFPPAPPLSSVPFPLFLPLLSSGARVLLRLQVVCVYAVLTLGTASTAAVLPLTCDLLPRHVSIVNWLLVPGSPKILWTHGHSRFEYPVCLFLVRWWSCYYSHLQNDSSRWSLYIVMIKFNNLIKMSWT